MPLNILLGAVEDAAHPIRHTPACPGRDYIRAEGDTRFVYGASDLWDAIHGHPDYHSLIERNVNIGGEMLDIIAEQVFPMCSECKSHVIKDVFYTLALDGSVSTPESAHIHADDDDDDGPTIASIVAAPDNLWMEDHDHDLPEETDAGYGYTTIHHRVAVFALLDNGIGDRWMEARSVTGQFLDEGSASGPCPLAGPGGWTCPGHFRAAPAPEPLLDE